MSHTTPLLSRKINPKYRTMILSFVTRHARMQLLVQLVVPDEHQRAKCIVAAQIRKIAIDSTNHNLIFREILKISDCVVHRRKPSVRHSVSSFLFEKIIPREVVLTGDCSLYAFICIVYTSNLAQIGKRRWGGIMPPRLFFSHGIVLRPCVVIAVHFHRTIFIQHGHQILRHHKALTHTSHRVACRT